MASAFDLNPEQAVQHFAELAEELLSESGKTETTDAAGRMDTKSLAQQQLEAARALAASNLAFLHLSRLEHLDDETRDLANVARSAGYDRHGKFAENQSTDGGRD